MPVSCGEAKPEEEDGDVVQLITKVQIYSFPQISIHHSKQINHAYWISLELGMLELLSQLLMKMANYLSEEKTNSVVRQQIR